MAIEFMTNIEVQNIRFTGPRTAEVTMDVKFRDNHLPEDANGGSAVFTVPVGWEWGYSLDRIQAAAMESLMDTYGDLQLLLPEYTELSKI